MATNPRSSPFNLPTRAEVGPALSPGMGGTAIVPTGSPSTTRTPVAAAGPIVRSAQHQTPSPTTTNRAKAPSPSPQSSTRRISNDDTSKGTEPTDPSAQSVKNVLKALKKSRRARAPWASFGPRSLFLFTKRNPFRTFCMKLVTNKWFDRVVLAIVLVNCVILAIDPGQSDAFDALETFFIASFTLEMVLKWIAMGFAWNGSHSYIRDPWNVLDFVVVILSYLSYVDGIENVTAIRAFRVLRPLRSIRAVPGMRILITALMATLPNLLDLLILLLFSFLIFGLIGMQLFSGVLRYRCYDLDSGEPTDTICARTQGGGYHCESNQFCGFYGENPVRGFTSFDNIGLSVVSIITIISKEGWTDIAYRISDATSDWALIYFTILMLVGGLFVMNLVTAVVFIRYENCKTEELLKRTRAAQEILEKERIANMMHASFDQEEAEQRLAHGGDLTKQEPAHPSYQASMPPYPAPEAPPIPDPESEVHTRRVRIDPAAIDATSEVSNHTAAPSLASLSEPSYSVSSVASTAQTSDHYWSDYAATYAKQELEEKLQSVGTVEDQRISQLEQIKLREPNEPWAALHNWYYGKAVIWALRIIIHPWFTLFINFCVLANVFVLTTSHYGMPKAWEDANLALNHVFTGIFTIEMMIKLIALSPRLYFKDSFNILDFVLVVLSYIDIILVDYDTNILRGLRSLRVFKLLRTWTFLRAILSALLESAWELLFFGILLLLFTFIFALLGKMFFQYKLKCEDSLTGEYGSCRTNFDTFPFALLAVFQILTAENWNDAMVSAVEGVGPASAIYFIILLFFGNYIVVAIFFAILLSNVDSNAGKEEAVDDRDVLAYMQAITNGSAGKPDPGSLVPYDPGRSTSSGSVRSPALKPGAPQIVVEPIELDSVTQARRSVGGASDALFDGELEDDDFDPLEIENDESLIQEARRLLGTEQKFEFSSGSSLKSQGMQHPTSLQAPKPYAGGSTLNVPSTGTQIEFGSTLNVPGARPRNESTATITGARRTFSTRNQSTNNLSAGAAAASRKHNRARILKRISELEATEKKHDAEIQKLQAKLEELKQAGSYDEAQDTEDALSSVMLDKILTGLKTNKLRQQLLQLQEDRQQSYRQEYPAPLLSESIAEEKGEGDESVAVAEPNEDSAPGSRPSSAGTTTTLGRRHLGLLRPRATTSTLKSTGSQSIVDSGSVVGLTPRLTQRYPSSAGSETHDVASESPAPPKRHSVADVSDLTRPESLVRTDTSAQSQEENSSESDLRSPTGRRASLSQPISEQFQGLVDAFGRRTSEQLTRDARLMSIKGKLENERAVIASRSTKAATESEQDPETPTLSAVAPPAGSSAAIATPPQTKGGEDPSGPMPGKSVHFGPDEMLEDRVEEPTQQPGCFTRCVMSVLDFFEECCTRNETLHMRIFFEEDDEVRKTRLLMQTRSRKQGVSQRSGSVHDRESQELIHAPGDLRGVSSSAALRPSGKDDLEASSIPLGPPSPPPVPEPVVANYYNPSKPNLEPTLYGVQLDGNQANEPMKALGTSVHRPRSLSSVSDERPDPTAMGVVMGFLKDAPAEPEYADINGLSLGFIPPNHPIRAGIIKFLHNRYVNGVLILSILYNVVILILADSRVRQGSYEDHIYDLSDIVVTSIFALEAVLKIIAYGLVCHRNAYLRDGWNILDLFIVITSFLHIGFREELDSFRAFRALRPLRFVARIESMRVSVVALVSAAKGLGKVLLVGAFFFVVFAIIGVELFKGRLMRCETLWPDGTLEVLYGVNRDQCQQLINANVGANPSTDAITAWKSPTGLNFDHFGNAFIVLFEVSTFEMWPQILALTMDATNSYDGPQRNATSMAAWFYVLFVLVGGFFIVSLFVGAVVDEYTSQVEEFTGSADLSEDQQNYLESFKDVASTVPPVALMPPRRPICCFCFDRRALERIKQWALASDQAIVRSVLRKRPQFASAFTASNMSYDSDDSKPGIYGGSAQSPSTGLGSGRGQGLAEIAMLARQKQLEEDRLRTERLMEDQVHQQIAKLQGGEQSPLPGSETGVDEKAETNAGNGKSEPSSPQGDANAHSVSTFEKVAEQESLEQFLEAAEYSSPYYETRYRFYAYKLVTDPLFDKFVVCVIVLNTLLMCMTAYETSKEYDRVLQILNDICTWILVGEAVVSIIGLGKQYFQSFARVFDFVVVAVSLIPFFMRTAADGTNALGIDPNIFRIVRVFRIIRLARRAPGIQLLVRTFIYSIPALISLGVLMCLVLLIYSIAGMALFGKVRPGQFVNRDANFSTFLRSMFTLFRSCTGEAWNGIMHDLMVDEPFCRGSACGRPVVAPIYYLTFIVICTFLFLNVFVAVVVNNFENEVTRDDQNRSAPVKQQDIEAFAKAWAVARQQQIRLLWINEALNYLSQSADMEPEPSPKPEPTEVPTFNDIVLRSKLAVSSPPPDVMSTQTVRETDPVSTIHVSAAPPNPSSVDDQSQPEIPADVDVLKSVPRGSSTQPYTVTTATTSAISTNPANGPSSIEMAVLSPRADPLSPETPSLPDFIRQTSAMSTVASQCFKHPETTSTKSGVAGAGRGVEDFPKCCWMSTRCSCIGCCPRRIQPCLRSCARIFECGETNTLAYHPLWMHISKLRMFLNTAPAPLGFAGSPLTNAGVIRFLAENEIRQYRGYVHYADIALALTTLRYRELNPDSILIPDRNEKMKDTKYLMQRNFAQLSKIRQHNYGAAVAFASMILSKQFSLRLRRIRERLRGETFTNDLKASLNELPHPNRDVPPEFQAPLSTRGTIETVIEEGQIPPNLNSSSPTPALALVVTPVGSDTSSDVEQAQTTSH